MAKDNAELSVRLADSGAKMTPLALKEKASRWFEQNQLQVAQLMGSPSEAKRLYLAVMNTVSRNPKLIECEPTSIFKCLVQCAELKLYPGPLGEAALVPYWNSKKNCYECQFQTQYQGILKLAYNTGFLRKVICRVVWSADEFEYRCGTDEFIRHIPFSGPDEDRGEREGVYCIVTTKYGEQQVTYLNKQFIERTKKRSRGSDKSDSPWSGSNPDDLDWMWKKTALRQALKLIPKSAELAEALEKDDAVNAPESVKAKIIDLTPDNDGGENNALRKKEEGQEG